MSVQISIDRPALAKLIADDPQSELNLKTAVLSEVARRFFDRDKDRIISSLHPALFAGALAALREEGAIIKAVKDALEKAMVARDPYRTLSSLSPQAKRVVDAEVARLQAKLLDDVEKAFAGVVSRKVEEVAQTIETRLSDKIIAQEIDKAVRRRVSEQLAKIRTEIEAKEAGDAKA